MTYNFHRAVLIFPGIYDTETRKIVACNLFSALNISNKKTDMFLYYSCHGISPGLAAGPAACDPLLTGHEVCMAIIISW